MQKLSTLLIAATFSLAAAANASEQNQTCGNASFTEVKSLSALPAGLRTALAAASPRGKIADANEPWNATDVIFDEIPDQRFRSGRVAPDCARILVERRAEQYREVDIVFRRVGDAWAESVRIVTPPQWSR